MRAPSGIAFNKIATEILGKDYDLSLVFINSNQSRVLNRTYRDKDKPTNILSFPLDKKTGEIFIDLTLCKKECASFERTYSNFLQFLFIHGLLHLKGYRHGSTMERTERQYQKKFGV